MRTHIGRIWRTAAVAAGLGITFLAGCSDALAPESIAGTYGWRGNTAVVLPGGEAMTVLADTIVLRADGTGYGRLHATLGANAEPLVQETEFSYIVEGRGIGISLHCPDICSAIVQRYWLDVWGETLIARDHSRHPLARVGDAP